MMIPVDARSSRHAASFPAFLKVGNPHGRPASRLTALSSLADVKSLIDAAGRFVDLTQAVRGVEV